MQRITREQARKYAFDWRDEPLLRVKPGESFEIETYDASTGFFKTPEDKAIPGKRPGFDRYPPHANPIGGPVYLEGAERGDVLVVSIEDIVVDEYSWVAIGPRRARSVVLRRVPWRGAGGGALGLVAVVLREVRGEQPARHEAGEAAHDPDRHAGGHRLRARHHPVDQQRDDAAAERPVEDLLAFSVHRSVLVARPGRRAG